ncbi:HAD family hydrolase [Paenibacillus sp. GCM10023252]|uniref:HAD family hydrolase n=1 Tax=Paenibacillus sp. GCM10023252 TaxID=3252649 RepID=UPI00360CF63C
MIWRDADWMFFDVGETLVDESPPLEDIFHQLVQQAELRRVRLAVDDIRQLFIQAHTSFDPSPMSYVMKALIPSEELRGLIRAGMKYNKRLEQPFPDAKRLLDAAAPYVRIGIIANQSEGTAARLKEYGLDEHIEAVISSAEEGLSKPDLGLYQLALDRTGCRAARAIMVGDRIDNDIIPAKKIGMKAIWVRQGFACNQRARCKEEEPDLVVNMIRELYELVRYG